MTVEGCKHLLESITGELSTWVLLGVMVLSRSISSSDVSGEEVCKWGSSISATCGALPIAEWDRVVSSCESPSPYSASEVCDAELGVALHEACWLVVEEAVERAADAVDMGWKNGGMEV